MSKVRVALHSVTFAGFFYAGPPITLFDMIAKARELGYEAVEPMAKRPHAFPMDLDRVTRKGIREEAESNNINMAAIAGYTNFAGPDVESMQKELLYLKETIRLAVDLGAPLVRIFAAGMKELAGRDPMRLWYNCLGCVREGTRIAEEHGVTLALQNHPPVIRQGYEDVLEMVEDVGSDNLKISLDMFGFAAHQQTEEYLNKAVDMCGDKIVHTHFGGNFREAGERVEIVPGGHPTNYPAFANALKKIGYKGYWSYEVCSPVLEGHKYHDIHEVERRARLAPIYIRQLMD